MLGSCSLMVVLVVTIQQPSFSRGQDFTLPITSDGSGGSWGLYTRNADHATVAINSNLDILIAYHTARSDTNPTWDLKQVEAQLYEWNGANTWTRVGVMRLGDINYDPLGITLQPQVRCERPDVVAVGDRFFVAWTRRYSSAYDPAGSQLPYEEEPAVLEGAWIQEETGAGWRIYDGGSPGLGILLDRDIPGTRNFWIRECSGVPDVVALTQDTTTGTARVGIAYPHQYDFGDWAPPPTQPDGTRECDLRFITCTITGTANATITKDVNPFALKQAIKFNGTGTDDSGFILPDLAPSAPSLPNSTLAPRFVMAFEEQFHVGPLASDVDGRIRVAQWEWNGTSWVEGSGHSFGSASPLAERRRVNLSSYPANLGATDADLFAIAFNVKAVGGTDREVFYKEWILSSTMSGVQSWPAGYGWPNGVQHDDFRPIPLHARNAGSWPNVTRLCAAERVDHVAGTCDLLEYDLATNAAPTVLIDDRVLARPAYAYAYGASDNTVTTS